MPGSVSVLLGNGTAVHFSLRLRKSLRAGLPSAGLMTAKSRFLPRPGRALRRQLRGFRVQVGNQHVVQFLIAHGADVNAKDYNGMTPLDYAKLYAPNSGFLHEILKKAGAH
jgi:Ankyrin repeats (many copies)